MDRPRRPGARSRSGSGPGPDAGSGPRSDRGLLGLLRALFTFVVLCALIAGAILAGPTIVDELDRYANPVEVEEPPPAGERSPDTLDVNDPGTSTYDGTHTTFSSADVEDFVHLKVNEKRAERGLDPLDWDGTVASVSRAHSADMAEREYFSHENPDNESPFDRFQDVSGYCRGYGENIAMTWADQRVQKPSGDDTVRYRTPEELAEGLVEQWMNSPPHREAILSDTWDRGGVGVYLSGEGQVYATHNFCTEF
ncbi:CAP domain-containing protein [Halobacteria archaeon AArc-m2/3/4]|uniref:CAP domain-containing protein n=1 Tax=Natronoglomus mannanivorans TaxID=2979990 RepID=A0ABT2Q9N8_9EURY|nr:CAP domain-containing protein [Halobacteria archaeon AArc-m2/3/4]